MLRIVIYSVFLFFLTVNPASAQFNDEALQKDLERMEEQFQEIFKDLGIDAESGIFVDTFFFKNLEDFQLGEGIQELLSENLELDEMINLMEQGMEKMESIDLSEFKQLFEAFGYDQLPQIPVPEDSDEAPRKKKKRKTYSM